LRVETLAHRRTVTPAQVQTYVSVILRRGVSQGRDRRETTRRCPAVEKIESLDWKARCGVENSWKACGLESSTGAYVCVAWISDPRRGLIHKERPFSWAVGGVLHRVIHRRELAQNRGNGYLKDISAFVEAQRRNGSR